MTANGAPGAKCDVYDCLVYNSHQANGSIQFKIFNFKVNH